MMELQWLEKRFIYNQFWENNFCPICVTMEAHIKSVKKKTF